VETGVVLGVGGDRHTLRPPRFPDGVALFTNLGISARNLRRGWTAAGTG
jgi:hypothetical protein